MEKKKKRKKKKKILVTTSLIFFHRTGKEKFSSEKYQYSVTLI